jgi:hypothetical protein
MEVVDHWVTQGFSSIPTNPRFAFAHTADCHL